MKKNHILSILSLATFNSFGMLNFINLDSTEIKLARNLAKNCNKHFECLKSENLEDFSGAKEALKALLGDQFSEFTNDQLLNLFMTYKDEVCRKAVFDDHLNDKDAEICSKLFSTFNTLQSRARDVPHFNYPIELIIDFLGKNKKTILEFYKALNLSLLLRYHNDPDTVKRLEYHLGLNTRPDWLLNAGVGASTSDMLVDWYN